MVLLCAGPLAVLAGAASEEKLPKKYTETVTVKGGDEFAFDMVLIPGGAFLMGSPESEPDRGEDEGPQHQVRLDPFYLCTTETTLDLFQAYYRETSTAKKDFFTAEEEARAAEMKKNDLDAITGPTPVYGDMTMGYGKKHPAIGLTWHNAATFCKWLSKKTGKDYRLPTEAEWEYAARAGAKGPYPCGDDPEGMKEYAWYNANSGIETHEVASKKPNAWGLYDMYGNVWEWVSDFYSPTAYAENAKDQPSVNPKGPKEGRIHAARGGWHAAEPKLMRCAARGFQADWWNMNDPQIPKSKWWLPDMDVIGFRVACSVPEAADKATKK